MMSKNISAMNKALVAIFFFISSMSVLAVDDKLVTANTGLNLTDNIALNSSVYPAIISNPTWYNDFDVKAVSNEIIFGIDQSIYQTDAAYKYKIVFDLEWDELSGVSLVNNSLSGVELELDYDPIAPYQDQEVYGFNGGVHVEATNIQLYKWNVGTTSYDLISVDRENLFLKISIETEYYHDFKYSITPSDALSLSVVGSDLHVSWPYLMGAEEYDLEWTWVSGYAGTTTGGIADILPESAVSYNFGEDATRIRLSGNQFKIPLVFGDGYLLVRYRGVGRVLGHPDTPVEGVWMTHSTSYGDQNTVSMFPIQCKVFVSAFESNEMNYGASVKYSENGVHHVSVAFTDGTGKQRQNQTQMSSTETLIIGSTIYDYYGRPAIDVMKSPVAQTDLGFVENLNMFDITTPYDKSVFHQDAFLLGDCGPDAAPPMSPSSSVGSAKYYSTQNPDKEGAEAFVPNSYGYNFMQVHYANDQTKTIRRIGAVGPDHQLDANGHYTEMIFDTPGMDEVDELLGSEAAHVSNYSKIITRDVHGQVSVVIQDSYGRTVISYLEGAAPAGLDPIEGNGPLTAINVDLVPYTSNESALLDQGILMVEKKIAVTDPNQIYTFNYDFESVSFTDCLPPDVCFDCIYEVEFKVTPAEGSFSPDCKLIKDGVEATTYSWTHTVGEVNDFDIECDGPFVFSAGNPSTFTLKFPRFGEYYVTKTLKVSHDPIEYYWDEYVENADASCIIPYETFLAEALLDVDFSDCFDGPACQLNFLYEYGTWDQYSTATGETDYTVYTDLQEQYIIDCENAPVCEQMRPMLLADVSPGGQYGDVSGTAPLSVFTIGGGSMDDWRDVTFYEVDGVTPAMTVNTSGVSVPVNDPTISLVSFLSGWQTYWAESLLKLHPEYYTYQFCAAYPGIFDYYLDFKLTDTYADAVAAGYITPVNPALYPDCYGGSPEPFTSGDPLINEINGALGTLITPPTYFYDDVVNVGNDYKDACLDLLTACPGLTLYETASELSDGKPFGTSACDLDAQWKAFRDVYLARRNIILQIAMEGYALSFAGTGCIRCIGYTAPSYCTTTCPDYATKVKRFTVFDQVMPSPFIDLVAGGGSLTALSGTATAGSAAFCEGACESSADGWMNELSDCITPMGATTWDVGDPVYDGLKADLIAVCKGGCSGTWPFPSQYNNDVSPVPAYLTSFEDVIVQYIGGPETIECNHYLIDMPSPVEDLSIMPTLSDCGCDQLLSVHDEAEFEATFGFIPLNFCKDRETCANIGGLNPNNIYPEGSIVWTPTQIANLEAEFTGTNYGCAAPCIYCQDLQNAIAAFLSQFPTASVDDNPVMFTSFINEMFGTGFDYYSLTTFMENCDSLSTGGIISAGLTQEATDLLNLLNAFIPDDLLTITVYGAFSPAPYDYFPAYFESTFYDCVDPGYYGYVPNFNSGTGMLFFSLNPAELNGLPIPCNYCPKQEDLIYLMPESLVGWTDATELYNNIISFTSIYVTALDLTSGPPPVFVSFHLTALVYNPSTGLEEEVVFSGRTQCFQVFDGDKLCGNIVPPSSDDCIDALTASAEMQAEANYAEYLATQKEEFIADYIETCRQVDEDYSYDYQANKYHYTLLYYDRAGNLVKSVSPKGVNPLSASQVDDVQAYRSGTGGSETYPAHSFVSSYTFNALNQIVEKSTPDQGLTKFWYDNYARMVVSQDARQAALTQNVIDMDPTTPGTSTPEYSYILFDGIGRIKEAGGLVQPTAMSSTISKDPVALQAWIDQIGSGIYTHQTVKIAYSEPFDSDAETEFGGDGHGDSRNRVVSLTLNSTYQPQSGPTFTPDYQSHYSYDVHGNIKSYLHETGLLYALGLRYTRTDYSYDLISNVPLRIDYQKGKIDQFSHKYKYDADNHLKEVWTSKDGHIWDRDVDYDYRLDGYLARTELGDMKVQGSDFTYTIHGWLKSMNSSVLNPLYDMGKDGTVDGAEYESLNPDIHGTNAQDAYGYTLDYFEGDYGAIDTDPLKAFMAVTYGTSYGNDMNGLFNSNIAGISNAMMDENESPLDVTGVSYHYDQLHRLKESHVFTASDVTTLNSFVNTTRQNLTVGSLGSLGDWEVHVDYDMNGNIVNLDRRAHTSGSNNRMDEFTYSYPSTKNQLDFVSDAVSGTGYGDIQSGQTTGNYQYHGDGSLLADEQEDIEYIEWYPNGKVKYIYRTAPQTDLMFEYNASGVRVRKTEIPKDMSGFPMSGGYWLYTWYMPDANGKIMGIYTFDPAGGDTQVFRDEAMIYGMKRHGIHSSPQGVNEVVDMYFQRHVGDKRYEITDHLSNVKEVITDRKISEEIVTSPGTFKFLPDVVLYSDYYPYGMEMAGRHGSVSNDYRFLFNGMESDMEISGEGNSYTTSFRHYDPRLGRWKSVDPLARNFPMNSPYIAFNDNPVFFVDPSGLAGEQYKDIKIEGDGTKSNPYKVNHYSEGYKIIDGIESPQDRQKVYFTNGKTTLVATYDKYKRVWKTNWGKSGTDETTWDNRSEYEPNTHGKPKRGEWGYVAQDEGYNKDKVDLPHGNVVLKGGTLDGKNTKDLYIKSDESTFYSKDKVLIDYWEEDEMTEELTDMAKHLEVITDGISIVALSSTAAGVTFKIYKKSPAGLIITLVTIPVKNSVDSDVEAVLLVLYKYFDAHLNDRGKGILVVTTHTGNGFLPGSEKVTIEFYDAATGKLLDSIDRKDAFH